MDIYFQSTGREDVQLKLENLRTRFHRLFTFGLTGNAQANSIALGSIDDNHQRSLVISAINREMSKKHQRGDAVGRDEIGGYSDAAAEDEDSDYEMFDKFKSLVDRLKANELRPTYRSKRSKRKKPLLPSWPLTVYTGGGDGGDRAGLGCNEASSDPRTAVSADGSEEGMPDPEQLQQQQQQQQLLFLPDLPTGDHRPQQQQQYKQKNLHQQQLIQRFMMQLDEDKENSSSTATATATTTTQVDEVQREAGKIGSAMSSVNKGPTGLHCLKRSFVTTLENQEEQIEFEQGMDFCHVLSKIRRVLDEHRDKMECEDEEEGNLETPTSSVEMTSTISTTTATSISSSIRSILMSAAVTDGTACGEGETLDLSFQLVEMKANLGNKLLSRGHDAVSVSNLLQQI